jgi:hypothetical protein
LVYFYYSRYFQTNSVTMPYLGGSNPMYYCQGKPVTFIEWEQPNTWSNAGSSVPPECQANPYGTVNVLVWDIVTTSPTSDNVATAVYAQNRVLSISCWDSKPLFNFSFTTNSADPIYIYSEYYDNGVQYSKSSSMYFAGSTSQCGTASNPICTPGQTMCNINALQQCSSDGTYDQYIKSCQFGCTTSSPRNAYCNSTYKNVHCTGMVNGVPTYILYSSDGTTQIGTGACTQYQACVEGANPNQACFTPNGCAYNNPQCGSGYTCLSNICQPSGNLPSTPPANCNPACNNNQICINNQCVAQSTCPTDVQLCPGTALTYVTRNPNNNCQFPACPLTPNQNNTGIAIIIIVIGFIFTRRKK